MVRKDLPQARGWKVFHLPLCVCSYHTNMLVCLEPGILGCLPHLLTNVILLLGLDCFLTYIFQLRSFHDGSCVYGNSSHFPEHVQGCVDRSLLVTLEAAIALCNAESLMLLMSVPHIVISVSLSCHGDNEPPPFPPARAHWIRAISKVRLRLQEVGWSVAALLLSATWVLHLWLKDSFLLPCKTPLTVLMFYRQKFDQMRCVGLQHVVVALELSNSTKYFEHHCMELETNIRKCAEAEILALNL